MSIAIKDKEARISNVGQTGYQRIMAETVRRARQLPLVPMLFLLLIIIAAVFAPLLAPNDPNTMSLRERFTPPFWYDGGSMRHLLGTDELGRDVLSRVIYGARISLIVGATAVIAAGTIGSILGLLAGYARGVADSVIMRVADSWIAMPAILIALILVIVLKPGLMSVITIIGATYWPFYARIARAEVLTVKERDFVKLARVSGASPTRILFMHIMPNIVDSLIVMATLQVGTAIMFEASLSFLGFGVQSPTATWGSMISAGRSVITYAWWLGVFPGLALAVTVLSCNMIGDWLRDYIDPYQRRSRV